MYDFLRGDENYKFDWSDNLRMTVAVQVASDSRAARWHVAGEYTRDMARALLPEWAKTRIRHMRQRSASSPFNPTPLTTEIIRGSEREISRATAGQVMGG